MADSKYGVLENVIFAYAKIAEPTKKFESEDTTYEVDCVVTKEQYKAWNKEFPKQKGKEYDREDFEARFKLDAPYDGDEIYVIKLRKAASKDGEVFDTKYRPRVLLDTNDGERVDITESRLMSNGCKGKVSYYITENSFGKFGQLQTVLMEEDDFIEYKSTGGVGSEFGSTKAVKVEAANESATKARANKAVKEPEPEDEPAPKAKAKANKKAPVDDDSDSPPF